MKIDELRKNTNELEEKERLDALARMYMDYQLHVFPEFGTFIGKPS